MLRQALLAITNRYELGSPLVFSTVGISESVYRADRTPPTKVSHVSDLNDLGPAVSTSEAFELAGRDAEAADREFQERQHHALSVRRLRWERTIRRRFTELARRALSGEMTLKNRVPGNEVSATLAWLDLGTDQDSGWCNAEAFRQHLAMDLIDLLPNEPFVDDGTSDARLRRERVETGSQLVRLIREWSAIAMPPYEEP
jgi:hypothetical protein